MSEENKKGAGRPRNPQYYLITCDVNGAKVEFAFQCDKFPRKEIIAKNACDILHIPFTTVIIINVFQFPCEEDFINFNLKTE